MLKEVEVCDICEKRDVTRYCCRCNAALCEHRSCSTQIEARAYRGGHAIPTAELQHLDICARCIPAHINGLLRAMSEAAIVAMKG